MSTNARRGGSGQKRKGKEVVQNQDVDMDMAEDKPASGSSPSKLSGGIDFEWNDIPISDDVFARAMESPSQPRVTDSKVTRLLPSAPIKQSSSSGLKEIGQGGPMFPPLPGNLKLTPPITDTPQSQGPTSSGQDPEAVHRKALEMLTDSYWDAQCLDSIKVSTGFLDSEIHDMLWMQNRLLDHHDNLIRTRNLIEKTSHALQRSQAMRAKVTEIGTILEEIAGATTKDMEGVVQDSGEV